MHREIKILVPLIDQNDQYEIFAQATANSSTETESSGKR